MKARREFPVKVLAFWAGMLAAGVGHAKDVTFSFDIHQSSSEIYPCDAGIVQKAAGQYCHFKGTSTACSPADVGRTPAAVGAAEAIDYNTGLPILNPADSAYACICTGASGGDHLMNFIRYKASMWQGSNGSTDPNHLGWGPAVTGVLQSNTGGATVSRALRGISAEAANSVPQSMQTQLEAVTFNLSSELYGAQYFVDLCYRGPQTAFYLSPNNSMNAIASFATRAYITASNPFHTGTGTTRTKDYVSMADLNVSWDLACDQQGLGTYKWDHNGTTADSGAYDTFITDLNDTGTRALSNDYVSMTPSASSLWVGNLNGANGEFRRSGSLTSATLAATQQTWLFGSGTSFEWIGINNPYSPRFCKLRYYFAERPFRDRERAWQRADARMVVHWAVEEPESN